MSHRRNLSLGYAAANSLSSSRGKRAIKSRQQPIRERDFSPNVHSRTAVVSKTDAFNINPEPWDDHAADEEQGRIASVNGSMNHTMPLANLSKKRQRRGSQKPSIPGIEGNRRMLASQPIATEPTVEDVGNNGNNLRTIFVRRRKA